MKRFAILFGLIISLMLPGLAGLPAQAQGSGWTPPVQLSGERSSWFPDLAVAPDGGVHVIWSSGIPREGEIYDWDALMHRALIAGNWTPANDIAIPGAAGSVSRNSIVVGRDGLLHVLLRSDFRIDYMRAAYDRAESAADWSAPRRISSGDLVYYDELAIDSKGRLHVVWTEQGSADINGADSDCPLCSDLHYRYSDDGVNWSTPINLSQMPLGSDKPSIVIDARDRIHVAWDEGNDRFVESDPKYGAYRRSDDGGLTWGQTVLFSLPSDDAVQQTGLGVTGDGNPLIVYRSSESSAIYYQVSPDGGATWQAAQLLPGVRARSLNQTPYDHFALATGGAGSVQLILAGHLTDDASGTPRLLRLAWNGRAWSAPEIVVSNDLYPEWPSLVIENGNRLHLAWFTRSEEDLFTSDEAVYKVWYSSRSISAPEATPLPQFTPAPTPTPSPTPQPPASPTPVATIDPAIVLRGAAPSQPQLDNTAVSLLVLSGAPVLAVIALVWVARRTRR
jgi:hypothetical protein